MFVCHSCQTGNSNTSISLERWTFFCLKRTLHSKKDYKIIPDYRGRSNFPYDLLCNEPRLSTCVAPPDNIHVQWFTDHNQDEKRKENGEKLFE